MKANCRAYVEIATRILNPYVSDESAYEASVAKGPRGVRCDQTLRFLYQALMFVLCGQYEG